MHNKKNFAIGLVQTAPSPALSGTSLILYAGQGDRMPATPFYVTVAPQGVLTSLDTAEVLEVTSRTGDTLTIVRAQKGTTAKEIGVDWLLANGIYTEDLDEYEPLLPETPTSPDTKYLNGNRQWAQISSSVSGNAASVYMTNLNSTIVGTYKQSSSLNDATETLVSTTANNNEVLAKTYLFEQPVNTTLIDAGVWKATITAVIDSAIGDTTLKFEMFKRSAVGVETTLFSSYSPTIENTAYDRIIIETSQPSFTVAETDRLGTRIYVKTTVVGNRTVTYKVGDGSASFFTTPLILRHAQLRDKNGETDVQHVTAAEKTAITHTNRSALDNVSGTNTGDQYADGVTITGDGTLADPFVGVGSNELITDETPTGDVNGSNLNFTASHAYTPGTMQVYINGVKQVRGTHFTEVGPGYTIFTMSEAPLAGDVISINYQTTISTSGNADTVDGFNANSTPTANTIPVLDANGKMPVSTLDGGLKSKIVVFTRDASASSGDVSYTGVGFTPSSIKALMNVDGALYNSDGFSDSSKTSYSTYTGAANQLWQYAAIITYSNNASWGQSAIVKSYDSDGFTLTWNKVGTPTAGTLKIIAICYR